MDLETEEVETVARLERALRGMGDCPSLVMAKIQVFLKKLPRNRQKDYSRIESILDSLLSLMSPQVPPLIDTMIQLNNRYGQLWIRQVLQSDTCLQCP